MWLYCLLRCHVFLCILLSREETRYLFQWFVKRISLLLELSLILILSLVFLKEAMGNLLTYQPKNLKFLLCLARQSNFISIQVYGLNTKVRKFFEASRRRRQKRNVSDLYMSPALCAGCYLKFDRIQRNTKLNPPNKINMRLWMSGVNLNVVRDAKFLLLW